MNKYGIKSIGKHNMPTTVEDKTICPPAIKPQSNIESGFFFVLFRAKNVFHDGSISRPGKKIAKKRAEYC